MRRSRNTDYCFSRLSISVERNDIIEIGGFNSVSFLFGSFEYSFRH